jgi:gas vesicle structural protein
MALQTTGGGAGGSVVEHEGGGGLADVVNTILDKGLVIDIFARVSLVGIELLRIDARVVVASVDTYLRFAQAANRLGMGQEEPAGLPGLMESLTESTMESGAHSKTKGVLDAAQEKLDKVLSGTAENVDGHKDADERPRRRRRAERVAGKERS